MLESPKFQNEELREEPEYLTREGFERLQKELEELKNRRLEIAKLLEEAIDDGDLTENAAFHGAKERQEENEMQIAELEDKLRRAAIIEKEKTTNLLLVRLLWEGKRARAWKFLRPAAK